MIKLLIIEESKSTSERLKQYLQQEGYEVFTACNGLEGLGIIKSNTLDIVITDILMPVMDGVEVILYLRKNCPEIKIIAMTSGGNINATEYFKVVKLLGVVFTLRKPFRENYLKNILNKLIENRFSFEIPSLSKVR